MTDKIIRIALGNAVPTMSINTLLEIIGATPNPHVALEKVLGIYEIPELPEHIEMLFNYQRRRNCLLTSYDEFKEEVSYTYDIYEEFYLIIDTTQTIAGEQYVVVSKSHYIEDFFKLHEIKDDDKKHYKRMVFYCPTSKGKVEVAKCNKNDWKETGRTKEDEIVIANKSLLIWHPDFKPKENDTF